MRVLYLTHRLPYAPNRGDRVRAYHTLQVLRDHASVDLVSLVQDADELAHVETLGALADSVHVVRVPRVRNMVAGAFRLATTTPLTHVLLDSPAMASVLRRAIGERLPDVVLAYCSGMARFAFEPPLSGLPVVVDMVDVDSVKWKALAATAGVPMRWVYRREATQLAKFEAQSVERAITTMVVNEREQAALRAIAPKGAIEVVPSGVDCGYWRAQRPAPSSTRDVVFCGVMDYAPNEQGALWLAREIWPRVRQRHATARLWLVGSRPTERVRNLARDGCIDVTGSVPDVRPYLWRSAVAVAPLVTARGIQNKVLEAVAAGLPAIVTSAVAEGLPPEILAACRIADSADEFADAIVQYLHVGPRERRALAERADLSSFGWDRRLAPLVGLLESAAGRGSTSLRAT